MFDPSSDDTAPKLDDLQSLTDITRFILDAKACAKRAEELIGLTIASNEAKAEAEQAQAALKASEAELAGRSTALDKREAELEAVEKRWRGRVAICDARERHLSDDGQRKWFLELIEEARGRDERTRRHVMRIAHLGFNEVLQRLPEWDAIIKEIAPGDAHFDQRPDTDATSDVEPYEPLMAAETVPAGSTLTRSKPQRRGAERH
jgi:hypothetical protein